MPRSLPILAMQSPSIDDPDLSRVFAPGLRASLKRFPETRLVVYPELHLCPVSLGFEAQAEPLDGPRVTRLCALAAELRVWLVPGSMYERGDDGQVYNTTAVISPEGALVASYRKCFPWRPLERVTPGRDFTVLDLDGVGRIGLSICYDLWFPEVARQLAWMGAEVIVQPNLTSTSDRPQELILARAGAIANQVFVLNVNASVPTGVGRSVIVGPEGELIYEAGESELAITEVLDLDQVTKVRRYGTAGLNRVWSQFASGDHDLPLPAYSGRIGASDWDPSRPASHVGA